MHVASEDCSYSMTLLWSLQPTFQATKYFFKWSAAENSKLCANYSMGRMWICSKQILWNSQMLIKSTSRIGSRKYSYFEKNKWRSIILDLKPSMTVKYCFIFLWHTDSYHFMGNNCMCDIENKTKYKWFPNIWVLGKTMYQSHTN